MRVRHIAAATALTLRTLGALAGIQGPSAPHLGSAAAAAPVVIAAQDSEAHDKTPAGIARQAVPGVPNHEPPVAAPRAGGSVTGSALVSHGSLGATVLGEAVDTTDPEALRDAILTPLLDRYAAEHGIAVGSGETDAFIAHLRHGPAAELAKAEAGLTADEAAEVDALRQALAWGIVRQWKVNQTLYAQYGGRIAYQQFGPEPLDALQAFLRQRQAEGAFSIHDPQLAKGFWRYFTDESRHDFMASGGLDAAQAFKLPPWERGP